MQIHNLCCGTSDIDRRRTRRTLRLNLRRISALGLVNPMCLLHRSILLAIPSTSISVKPPGSTPGSRRDSVGNAELLRAHMIGLIPGLSQRGVLLRSSWQEQRHAISSRCLLGRVPAIFGSGFTQECCNTLIFQKDMSRFLSLPMTAAGLVGV